MHVCTFARSFDVSVFPVPAGPAGAAPSLSSYDPVSVSQHRSVRGVITSRLIFVCTDDTEAHSSGAET